MSFIIIGAGGLVESTATDGKRRYGVLARREGDENGVSAKLGEGISSGG